MQKKKAGKQVNFRLSELTKRRLWRIAKLKGWTMTKTVSMMIKQYQIEETA